MAGEFVSEPAIAALEKGRSDALIAAEKTFQAAVGGGADAVISQATRDTAVAAAHATYTAAIARLAAQRAKVGSPR
jgi:hypothetical protein